MSEGTFKSDFVGKGSMKTFVDELNKLMTAMNNISVTVPNGYQGQPPKLAFQNGSLVFDFGDALIFTEKGVDWSFTGDGTVNNYSATPENGRLKIAFDTSAYDSVDWYLEGTATYNSWDVSISDGVLEIIVNAD